MSNLAKGTALADSVRDECSCVARLRPHRLPAKWRLAHPRRRRLCAASRGAGRRPALIAGAGSPARPVRPVARRGAGEPGVGNHRHTTADWPSVHTALHTQ